MFSTAMTLLVPTNNIAFNPLSNFSSGEKGFLYDISDFTSLFQDSAGTVAVTAVGQPVGKVTDKSGNGNHALQSTSGKRPVLSQDGSGKYYLAFDGTDDFLTITSLNMGSSNVFTIHIGMKYTTDVMVIESSTNGADYPSHPGSFFEFAGTDGGHTGYESLSGGTTGSAGVAAYASTFAPPDLAVLTFTHSIPAALSTVRRNQVAGTSGTATKGTGNFNNYQTWIGSRAGTSLFGQWALYGMVVRCVISDATDIGNNETWMNGKTGAY